MLLLVRHAYYSLTGHKRITFIIITQTYETFTVSMTVEYVAIYSSTTSTSIIYHHSAVRACGIYG